MTATRMTWRNAPLTSIANRIPPSLRAPAVLLGLTFLMFADVLFSTSYVVGHPTTDLTLQFLPWRKFGFDQLSYGNLALWNPHVYGGAPYFGGFQSALIYPINWFHLFMPVGLAINWITAVHVFLAGFFTHLWCKNRGLSAFATVLAGAMYMFSGPYFLHIYAGHLPHIAIMVWVPLLFLGIDLVISGSTWRGALIGAAALAAMLLAGHPQYVYYTAMMSGVYVLINLPRDRRIKFAIAGCAMIVAGGLALAAMQLFAGLDAASESVRQGGTVYPFSAMFSLPPENLLTLLAPNAFGELLNAQPPGQAGSNMQSAYFGRCYLWEVSLFVSISGAILATFGAIRAKRSETRGASAMVLIAILLALGAHTPIHHILYDWLPGFGSFRGSAKFIFIAALFICLLAACGFDALVRGGRIPTALLISVGALLFVMLNLAFVIRLSASGGTESGWAGFVRAIIQRADQARELFYDGQLLTKPEFFDQTATVTSSALFGSAFVIAAIFGILLLSRFRPHFTNLIVILAIMELFWFARASRAIQASESTLPAGWFELIKSAPPDARILEIGGMQSNLGMWFGYDDVWGYDPGVPKRYAELVARSQGINPDEASQYMPFRQDDQHIFPLLRCAMIFVPGDPPSVAQAPKPMNEVQLISNTYVASGRDQVLATIESNSFDPRRDVVLEAQPNVEPGRAPDSGTVHVVAKSTDWLEVEADVTSPAILLITNNFSRGWKVRPQGPAPQPQYQIVPADWAFQGIPLAAGHHHLIIEYHPTAYVIGKWISILSVFGYVAALWQYRSRRRVSKVPC